MPKIKKTGEPTPAPQPTSPTAQADVAPAAPLSPVQPVEMLAVTPDIEVAQTANVTTLPASPMFQFMAHPSKWTVLEGQVVPALSKFKLKGGVNGVVHREEKDGRSRYSYRPVQADFQEQGWQFIPWDVDGPGTSYVRQAKGRPDVHLSAWEKAFPGSDHIETDMRGYVAFCRRLILRGTIKPPAGHILAAMLDKYRKARAAALKRADSDERYRWKADSLAEKIKAVEAEVQRQRAALAPVETTPVTPDEED